MISSGHKPVPQGFIVEDGTVVACNGVGFRSLLQAGQKWLEVHVDFVNSLNVFPVPDGDTGTNMLLTMRSAIEQAGQASNHSAGTIADAVAQGALMGARGNSGVILSQFLQGLAQGVAGQTTFTAEDFAHAIQLGADQAYNSVVAPVEGTILTVAREAAEAAQKGTQDSHDLLLLLKKIVNAAKVAQANTPELLPVLKEALLERIQPQYIILKPSLVGGITGSSEWIEAAEARRIGWWVTSALESNVGLNAIAQWTATLDVHMPQGLGTGSLFSNNFESPLEVSGGKLWYRTEKDWGTSQIKNVCI